MDAHVIQDLRCRLLGAIERDTHFLQRLMDGDIRAAAEAEGRDIMHELDYTSTGLERAHRLLRELERAPDGRTPTDWEAIVGRLAERQHTYVDDIRCRLRTSIVTNEATMQRLATVEAMWSAIEDVEAGDPCYAVSIAERRAHRARWLLDYLGRYPPRDGAAHWWRQQMLDIAA